MRKINKIIILLLFLMLSLSGCTKSTEIIDSVPKVYYFNNTKNELVAQELSQEFNDLADDQQKLQYIIKMLTSNKEQQGTANSIVTKSLPIMSAISNTNDKNVQIYFNEEYNDLTINEKIGARASVVYSITQLDSIQNVSFFIEDQPLTASTGKIIGPISKANIKLNALAPNPVVTLYTLPLYFVNNEGELVKEERGISVSNPESIEKSLIEELIKGPSSKQLSPSLPPNVKINEVITVNGVCQVDLSLDLKSKFFNSDKDRERMLYSIVNSLTEITELTNNVPKIKKVAFLIDGKSDIKFTQDIQLRDTFERNEEYIGK